MLSIRLSQDMAAFPLDAPMPDLPLPNTSHGFARTMLAKARRDDMTLREYLGLPLPGRSRDGRGIGPAA
jgi:hypothetical protein